MATLVDVIFRGSSTGAVKASREVEGAVTHAGKAARVSSGHFAASERSLGRATRGAVAASGVYRSLGRSIAFASASFLGAAGFISVVRASVGAAGQLSSQIDKSQVLFKRHAGAVLEWSKTTANGIGLARAEALKYASAVGNLLTSTGVKPQAAATRSVAFVTRAADTAARLKEDPVAVQAAFAAALAGTTRGMRQYGVFLTEDRIKAEAFSTGIAETTKNLGKIQDAERGVALAHYALAQATAKHGANSAQAAQATTSLHNAQRLLHKTLEGTAAHLTAAQRQAAIYAITMKDTSKATGAFAKDSGSLTNQQLRLKANLKNVEALIGQALTPTLLQVSKRMNEWAQSVQVGGRNHEVFLHTLHAVVSGLRLFFSGIMAGIKILHSAVGAVGGLKTAVVGLLLALSVAKVAKFTNAILSSFVLQGQAALRSSAIQQGASEAVTERYVAGVATMRAATIGLAATIKAALLSTLIGGLLVAFGVMVSYIILHWAKVKKMLFDFTTWLQIQAKKMVLALLEPWSRLPWKFGEDARKAKVAVKKQLDELQALAEESGRKVGKKFGDGLLAGASPAVKALAASLDANAAATTKFQGATAGTKLTKRQKQILATARKLGPGSGIKYVFGGKTEQGFDCSGYLQTIYARNGVSIPGTSQGQWNDPNAVDSTGDERAGDGVYFEGKPTPGNSGPPPRHCGIYIGRGFFIEYYQSGKPARTSDLGSRTDYMGARRWIKINASPGSDSKSNTGGGGHQTRRVSAALAAEGAAFGITQGKQETRKSFAARVAAMRPGGQFDDLSKAPKQTPLFGQACVNYIATRAKQLGLDPDSVLAVASVEGGFNGKVGDHGTSFGPFQLHINGAMPQSVAAKGAIYARAWANSPAGLDYALRQIAKVAGGTSGANAVNLIVSSFEHPHDVSGEITKATGRLGKTRFKLGSLQGVTPTYGADKNVTTLRESIKKALAGAYEEPTEVSRITSDAGKAAIAALKALQKRLVKATHLTADQIAEIKASIKKYGTTVREELLKQSFGDFTLARSVGRSFDKVREAFDDETTAWHKSFDKVTEAQLASMQKGTDLALRQMQKDFSAVMRAFDKETQRGLDLLAAPDLTPAEAELANRAAVKAAGDLQKALQDAVASGDPAAIAAANYDIQTAALEAQAKQEREAADAKAKTDQEQYSEQRQALADSLNEQEQDREASFSEQAAKAEAAYQEQRDAEAIAYDKARAVAWQGQQDLFDDFAWWVDQKVKRWNDFLAWFAAHQPTGGPIDPRSTPNYGDATGQRPAGWHDDGTLGSGREAQGFARGGFVKGTYVGKPDTVRAWLTPGEEVLTREESAARRRGGDTYNVTVLGASERQVARALERMTKPERDRRVGFTRM